MGRLSVILITRNEEKNLDACLKSVAFADEIILVDSGSVDTTPDIAGAYGARVIETEWRGYAATRQIGLDAATGDWVLWIDADERVTPELAEEIREIITGAGELAGYYVARKAIFLGRWIKRCGWYPGYVLRLFRRTSARFSDDLVHERVEVIGRTGYLKHPLTHYTDPDLEHYLNKFNVYTSLAARQLVQEGRPFRLTDLLIRPIFAFIKMYVLKRGFLDGMPGLILCVLSGCYVFAKYAKLWHLWRVTNSRP
jgi:glycosyltransferase involved in cell wall biosynthesis